MYKLLGVEVESSTHYRDSRQVFICAAAAAAAARTTQGPRTPTQGSRSQRQLATRLPARERNFIPKGGGRLMVLGFMAPHLALQRVDTTTSVGSMHLKAMHKPYQ